MKNFQYFTPTKVIFGKETENQTGKLVREFGGTKVLVHYGSGSVVRSGLLDRVLKSLEAEGISYVQLGGAVPNPRLGLVYKGVDLCRQEGVDFILAVGGGSAIDSAKAIGYGAASGGDVWDFYCGKRKATGCLPLGVVLTIAATGSEMSSSSVITNEEGWLKRGYGSDMGRPKFAVMNPELTMTLPDYQTASGCVDILMHTIERYFSAQGNMEITDQVAEGLLRTVMKHARILTVDPTNYESRAEVMWSGSLSHNGLTGCGGDGGDWMPHKLEHELGGMYDVAHGAGLAALWGTWARYVYENCLIRFFRYAIKVAEVPVSEEEQNLLTEVYGKTMEELTDAQISIMKAVSLKGIEAMEQFFRDIKMPTNLRELGVDPTEAEYAELARKCAEGVGGAKGTAMLLHEEDMLKIYKMAY